MKEGSSPPLPNPPFVGARGAGRAVGMRKARRVPSSTSAFSDRNGLKQVNRPAFCKMADTLFNAYAPLIFWTGLGFFLIRMRFFPDPLPRLLGRSLYWFGVPWEVFALARHTHLSQAIAQVPLIAIATLVMGVTLAGITLQMGWQPAHTPAAVAKGLTPPESLTESAPSEQISDLQANPHPREHQGVSHLATQSVDILFLRSPNPSPRPTQGSFLIAATIGNTGFVGLGIVPTLVSESNLGWAVFYSVTNNVIGTYGLGVWLASYFGRAQAQNNSWVQFRDVLTVPSLWAFILGFSTRHQPFPVITEQFLQASLWFVIPAAFLLMGMRLSQLQGIQSLKAALLPSCLKILLLPGLVGLSCCLLGLSGEPRLALVLMAGMPSAFAGLILAEEYELDRDLIASSIAVSTLGLLLTIPLWLVLFGEILR